MLLAIVALWTLIGAANAHTHATGSQSGHGRRGTFSAHHTRPLPARVLAAVGASPTGIFNVLDYGAKGDNVTDNTAAFVAAISAAQAAAGGTVYAPTGLYIFQGSLTVPAGVTLRGSYTVVPSHDFAQGEDSFGDGTTFMPKAGRGNDSGTPFITVTEDGAIGGFVIYHPDQLATAVPVPYPYSISLVGNNAACTDIELLNSWNGISAVGAHRHYIARIQGQPINIGVFVDQTYDIGRIEDVHFNPWFSAAATFLSWQTTFGRAFVLGRSDWEYMFNCFAFGYAIGYHFINTPTGSMNGNFLGIGADLATNASVRVDGSQAPGILITNGEFTSFHDKNFDPESVSGLMPHKSWSALKILGPSDHIAYKQGQGVLSFTSCTFVQWDLLYHNGSAAIKVDSGSVVLQGNNFQQAGTQLELGAGVDKAIITGNLITGPLKIVDNGAKNVQKGLNADDPAMV